MNFTISEQKVLNSEDEYENVQNALRKVLVPLNHFVHRIVLLIAADFRRWRWLRLSTLTVVLRYCFNTGLSWAEEVPRLLVTLFAFIACAIGVRDHLHVAVNAVYNQLPVGGKARKALDVLTDVVVLLCGLFMLLHRRRAHNEALQHAGHAAHHRHFHRVAVFADPDCGLCDYV